MLSSDYFISMILGGEYVAKAGNKASNILPLWGNERTMNLNPLILTNIQSSHYFKGKITKLT